MNERAIDFVEIQRRFLLDDVPPVIGHRGAALHAPENTLAGIIEAKRQGARWVEVDIKLSSESHLFLMHDSTLDRTTNGVGSAKGRKMSEITGLDAGSWFGNQFEGEKVPALSDLFDLLIAENMSVNLEIKPNAGEEEATSAQAIAAVNRLWPNSRPKPLLSSFSIASLATARDLAPAITRGLLINAPDDQTLTLMEELACASLHVNARYCEADWLADMTDQGIPVFVYTVNDPERAIELLDQGAHSVITDTPGLIIEAILGNQ